MPTPDDLEAFIKPIPSPLDPPGESGDVLLKALNQLEKYVQSQPPVDVTSIKPKLNLDWTVIVEALDETGKDMLTIVKPFLPALARASQEVYLGFLQHLGNADWEGCTELLYQHMTAQEREQLNDVVYKGLIEAAQAKYDNAQLVKQILEKVAMDLLVKLATLAVL